MLMHLGRCCCLLNPVPAPYPGPQVPILHLLSERQLRQLAQAMETVSYKQGEVVFKAGAEADYFYVVEEGPFTVFDSEGLADWLSTCCRRR
jgi:CRP-like cAMP-binding protein